MEKEETRVITSPDKLTSLIMYPNRTTNNVKLLSITHKETIIIPNPSAENVPSEKPTTKAQKRISLQPHVEFFFSDEKIRELRIILAKRDEAESRKTELFNAMRKTQTQKNFEDIINIESEYVPLDSQLNIHLTPTDITLISDVDSKMQQILLSRDVLSSISVLSSVNNMIDQLVRLYRKVEAKQEFAKAELKYNASDKLFMLIQDRCQIEMDRLIETINNLIKATKNLEDVSQKQEPSNK